jgi:hypothetical protein
MRCMNATPSYTDWLGRVTQAEDTTTAAPVKALASIATTRRRPRAMPSCRFSTACTSLP